MTARHEGENDWLAWVRELLAGDEPARGDLFVGPGDDAAVIAPSQGGPTVITTDAIVEGVHFESSAAPRAVGWKAIAVNLSDVAAMAARPTATVIAITAPPRFGRPDLEELMRGAKDCAAAHEVRIVGGDFSTTEGPLTVTVTALGDCEGRRPVLRSGAVVGDAILVTGSLGGSILGRHLSFQPRVAEALALVERYALHAMMDVSDGLALDLARMAEASGVGAALDEAQIPVSEDARTRSEQTGRPALEHALGDGEDFELLMAVAPADADRMIVEENPAIPITRIGEITASPGLVLRDRAGTARPLEHLGHEHRIETDTSDE